MAWPQPTDYNAAVQNPALCFGDPDLLQGRAATDPLGLPRPHSGNFADVYQILGADGQAWAVKCFTREVHGLQERYQAVSDHLRQVHRRFMVDFHYLEQGIRIGGQWYPVVKMRWVEGQRLNEFISQHADKPGTGRFPAALFDRLAHMWVRLAQELREAQMAHGDLQHGNVLLVPGARSSSLGLRLIDYDGLCVPALAGRPSGEAGHPNYQHPRRPTQGGYGPDMDRFAHLVVYTALRCLAAGGQGLWRRHDTGENLLFRDDDFRRPADSRLLRELWGLADGDARALVGHLVLACQGPLELVPLLEGLVGAGGVRPLTGAEEAQVKAVLSLSEVAAAVPAPTQAPDIEPPTSDPGPPAVPSPTPEHRRVAAGQFERANQVVVTGNYDYGIGLLLSCCKLDPANLLYRQALRRTEKAWYRNNLRGAWHAWLTTWPAKARVKAALRTGDHLKVLEHGEQVLLRNPWDVAAQRDMAAAAEALGLLDLAIWSLEQARQKQARDTALNRRLARLYEKRGNFTQAIALWELVRRAVPTDAEAEEQLKDLAASETISRGHYDEVLGTAQHSAEKPASPVGRVGNRPGTEPVPNPSHVRPPSSGTLPALDRVAREAAPLRQRLEEDPTNASLYLQLATVYRRQGRYDEARTVLRDGLGPTANAFELTVELADLETEPFRRDLAITEEKLASRPDDRDLLGIRGRLRKEINTRELELYRRKADRYPADLGLRYEVGVRLFRAGLLEEAIRELQAARPDPRYRWQALSQLGHCFQARNNWRLAQRNFEDALQNLPEGEAETRKDLLFRLARGCAEAGDLDRAVDLAHELAHLDFSYRDIGRLLDEWQGRLHKARVSR
jgi:tetratricopeptide (TPR) repeat protein